MGELAHIDKKSDTEREAVAKGSVKMKPLKIQYLMI